MDQTIEVANLANLIAAKVQSSKFFQGRAGQPEVVDLYKFIARQVERLQVRETDQMVDLLDLVLR